MIKCARKFEFDAGHRVVGHQNKCQYVHGHRYVLEVIAESKKLDQMGMVVDFSLLKSIIQNWIDNNLDHTLILHEEDKTLGENIASWTGQKIYYLTRNPTAENIALHLKIEILPKLFVDSTFQIGKIKLYETPNCYVEV